AWLAARLSPQAQAVYAQGLLPAVARADDPGEELPLPAPVRSPATLDRAATVRWLGGAMACLGLFWGVSQFSDRLWRLYLVWGAVVAAFFVNTGFAVVQVSGQVGGLFGLFQPGTSSVWAPSVDELLTTPGARVLRTLPPPATAAAHPAWAALFP